jgi:Lon protease-like protein
MASHDLPSFAEPIGLFPLPNVVLFPGAALPLQVYEPRYRAMVSDALAGNGSIAIALLRPGYESDYYTNRADVHPVVGVGRIQDYVEIPDGCYFVNLTGLCRARIRREDRDGEYRLAMLDPMLAPTATIETDGEYAARRSIQQLLTSTVFDAAEEIDKARGLIGRHLPLGELVDRIASELLPAECFDVKQRLLEEMRVVRRAQTLVSELRLMSRVLETRQKSCDDWPRFGSMN